MGSFFEGELFTENVLTHPWGGLYLGCLGSDELPFRVPTPDVVWVELSVTQAETVCGEVGNSK